MSISVIGGGAWGTALAAMIARNHPACQLWARSIETVQEINTNNTNSRYLGNIRLPINLNAVSEIANACEADIILVVTPTQSLPEILPAIAKHAPKDAWIVLCAKGIVRESGTLPHQFAANHFPANRVASLSGPSFATDVAKGLPTAVSLACPQLDDAIMLAETLSGPQFRIYASDDLPGVELGGALKNVLAIAVGAARGQELGASAEAALIARGFTELRRLALSLGAKPETLAGLSGLGDTVLTCSSPQSRNFAYGMALGSGAELPHKLAEGAYTAGEAQRLARSHAVDVPIIDAVNAVLTGAITAQEAVSSLLARPIKPE